MTVTAVAGRSERVGTKPAGLLLDVPFLAILAGYVGLGLTLHLTLGYPSTVRIGPSSWNLLIRWGFVYAVAGFVGLLADGLVNKRKSLRRLATWKEAAAGFFRLELLVPFLLTCIALAPFMGVFVGFKMAIPDVVPFSWDERFEQWDRLLHFGRHPWELLQPILGYPVITRLLDSVYYLWFPVVWLTMLWQLWHGSQFSSRRSQFLIAFALTWIVLGTLAATTFSSVGPVYYHSVVGGTDPYAPLMAYLHDVDAVQPLTALWAQEVLWQSYINPSTAQIEGISAMPSLHVAMVTLLVFVGFHVNRLVGTAYLIFAVLILLGSVSLGWHYAIDGYAAVLGAWLIWLISGRIDRVWCHFVSRDSHTRATQAERATRA